jgi:4-aminobutyrate aminotransferase-like enzyme
MTFAKPLHVGATVAQRRLLQDWPGGKFSGTWPEGNLLSIAMATYTLQEIKQIDPTLQRPYPENARRGGEYMRQRVAWMGQQLDERYPGEALVRNVRGVGQMNAFDVPSKEFQEAVVYQSFLHGLHLLGTGERSIRLFGTVDQRQREADVLIHLLGDVIDAVMAHSQKPSSSTKATV